MEDPWAVGSSWTTDAESPKASPTKALKDLRISPGEPSAAFADSHDPWAPSAPKQSLPSPSPLPPTEAPTWSTPGDVWGQTVPDTDAEPEWDVPASTTPPAVTIFESPPRSPVSDEPPAVPSPSHTPLPPISALTPPRSPSCSLSPSRSRSPSTVINHVDIPTSLPVLASTGVGDDPWSRAPISPSDQVIAAPFPVSNRIDSDEDDVQGSSDDEGWGAATVGPPPAVSQPVEDDWELEQRKMQLKEARVPRDKVENMKQDWRNFGQTLSIGDLEETELPQAALDEIMLSLTVVPPNLNTYPHIPPVTHERFSYALTRPNPVPSTSFIHICNSRKHVRRSVLKKESPWLSRSKLSEPEAPESAAPAGSTPSARWSFWKRPAPERQLTTSGGSVLEIKTPASTEAEGRPSSVMSKESRPSSPALQSPQPTAKPEADTAGPLDSGQPPPSAVSRFFGRLGRKPSVVSMNDDDEDDNKADLALSTDDFDFLSDVPVTRHQSPGLALDHGATSRSGSIGSTSVSTDLQPRIAQTLPPPARPPVQQADLLGDWDAFESQPPTPKKDIAPASSDPLWSMFESSGPAQSSQPAVPPQRQPQAPPPLPKDIDDFDDFSTPSKGTQFDDFDFGDFESSTVTRPAPPSHVPALTLLGEANTQRGRRWPAPLSPGVPLLAPPPKQSAIPMLAPPPGGRSSSLDLLGETDAAPAPSPGMAASVGSSNPPSQLSAPATHKSGLSATDFSFFDNL